MLGLDAWIQGDNVCSYCGLYSCACEREVEDEEECPTCGYSAKEWRGEAACNDPFHAAPMTAHPAHEVLWTPKHDKCPMCGSGLSGGVGMCGRCKAAHFVLCVECNMCGFIEKEPCDGPAHEVGKEGEPR